mmetsp:Transcript_21401/g.38844  ORF Transcript_21401/g.38844 Transcript_21401/m.38844 type:complete len:93 (-) Transcript_21401:120-398(-)
MTTHHTGEDIMDVEADTDMVETAADTVVDMGMEAAWDTAGVDTEEVTTETIMVADEDIMVAEEDTEDAIEMAVYTGRDEVLKRVVSTCKQLG